MVKLKRRRFLGHSAAAAIATAALHSNITKPASSGTPVNHQVTIANFVFSPAVLPVNVGDRVTWTNKDIVPHTATAEDGSWDTGELGTNESAEILITKSTGTDYFCQYHPTMTARLRT